MADKKIMKKLIIGTIASVVIVVGLDLGIGVGLERAVGKDIDAQNMLAVVDTNYKNYVSYNDYDGVIPSGTGDFLYSMLNTMEVIAIALIMD